MRNALTVDVEDYFQVQAFAGQIGEGDWDSLPHRVERNTHLVMDVFADHGVKATFFTLGWVAERYPALVRRMAAEGHEVASHGFRHRRVGDMTPVEFREDTRRTKALLEDLSGTAVNGYRAASFSIDARTLWAHEALAEEGHRYSSSIYPIAHDIYGMPGGNRFAYATEGLTEVPVSTVEVAGRRLPCGGGGYFRLLPYAWSRWAWHRVNHADRQPAMLYFHPWEIDPDQPRQHGAPLRSRLRHYTRLSAMEGKIRRALRDFEWDRMDRVFLGAA
ncbi:XrtA system polysaccharide deacetylase [Iodidimonas sp. SYSU 1G8]|uniref:XrtA system polysaccharide deacetylase n=1 Tax=Iodidimonas sp. SYSU 1G8 TaxID=3133967 RepID=UPI0031FE84F9